LAALSREIFSFLLLPSISLSFLFARFGPGYDTENAARFEFKSLISLHILLRRSRRESMQARVSICGVVRDLSVRPAAASILDTGRLAPPFRAIKAYHAF
jgi:hypothetical protein